MGLLDDLSQFLENRLEEFLRNNPHLELQALLEQLREQEKDTIRLILDLQAQEQHLQSEILRVAQDIQLWHDRAGKARAVGRLDLAQEAETREAELLREGNQRWGQMQGCRERIQKTRELQAQIQQRSEEVQVQAKAAQAQRERERNSDRSTQENPTPRTNQGSSWSVPLQEENSSNPSHPNAAQLDAKFARWEMEMELEEMKRQLGR